MKFTKISERERGLCLEKEIKIKIMKFSNSMENLEEILVNDKIIDMVILDNIQMYSYISKHDSSIMNAKLFGFYLSISMEIYTKYS